MKLYYKEGGADPCDIAQACGGVLLNHSGRRIRGITSDSRQVKQDDLFVAIRGENFDGHDYLGAAFSAGAACALVDHIPRHCVTGGEQPVDGRCLILCDDTVRSLGLLAHEYKKECHPYTVAVTGSVGKTTTKELIAAVLAEHGKTHKTEGNFNNEIGLPFTLLGLEKDHEAMVVEMGMSAAGEIRALSRTAEPDMAVITNIGSSHIENLGSRENICRAKLEIVEGLKPGGGLILNGDEPLLSGISGAFYIAFDNDNADMHIKNVRENTDGTLFDLIGRSRTFRDLFVPSLGRHSAFDASVAVVIGLVLGMNEEAIRRGLSRYVSTGMRQHIYEIGAWQIIEDCYNASPESMRASLGVLTGLVSRDPIRRQSVAVLGEMKELGDYGPALHREVGRDAAALGLDRLITFGPDAAAIAEGARAAGMAAEAVTVIASTDDKAVLDAAEAVRAVTDGRPSTVLFKASRAVRLERVIDVLKA